jgi:hypothetical protein
MGSKKRIPTGRECFVHLGFGSSCPNILNFLGSYFTEAFGNFGPGLIAPGADSAKDALNAFGFHGVPWGFYPGALGGRIVSFRMVFSALLSFEKVGAAGSSAFRRNSPRFLDGLKCLLNFLPNLSAWYRVF